MYGKIDVLLVRPNDQKAVYGNMASNAACEPPYWAACIAAYCRKKGKKVAILDAEAFNMSPEDIADEVERRQPALVILTVTGTNLSASTWKMHGAGLCASAVKKRGNIPIMMWGLHPSALPQKTLEDENIDFVMKGEGLESIASLIKNIHNTKAYEKIDGLYYKSNEKIILGGV